MMVNKLNVLFILAAFSFSVNAENAAVVKPATIKPAANKVLQKSAPVAIQPAVKQPLQMATRLAQATPIRVLLLPEKETTISSTIGARLVSFNGTLGQNFRAGDLLLAFDCEEALARVDMSQAELSGAIDQHEAKVKMQGLDQASDIEVALAASASNKAKAQLNLNKAQVSQCKIYAPWAGRVAKANVKNHMSVTPGQPLMELVKDGPLKLKLNLPSKLLAQVKKGSKFTIMIDETGLRYPASVSAVNSRVDPVSQTVEVEAKLLKSYSELLAGMSGVADFSANAEVPY